MRVILINWLQETLLVAESFYFKKLIFISYGCYTQLDTDPW